MSFLILPHLGQRTLRDYMDELDYFYDAAPHDGWRPSEWLNFLAHWDARPHWHVELAIESTGLLTRPILFLVFLAYFDVDRPNPMKLGFKRYIQRREVVDEASAERVVRDCLGEIAKAFVREGFRHVGP